VGRGVTGGGHLNREAAGFGFPVEQAPFDVGDGDGSGVVVGLVAMLFGAVVPGVAAGVGVPIRVLVFRCSSVSLDMTFLLWT
jgi:hypothetical protein